jgi:hypothetical protein
VAAVHKAAQVLPFLVLVVALRHITVIMAVLELTDLAAVVVVEVGEHHQAAQVWVYQAAEMVQVYLEDRLALLILAAVVVEQQAILLAQVVLAVQVLQALLIGHKKQIMIWQQPIGIYL